MQVIFSSPGSSDLELKCIEDDFDFDAMILLTAAFFSIQHRLSYPLKH